MRFPPPHVPPLYLPKLISVSHTHSLPSSSLPQGQNGRFSAPGTPVCSLPMANDQSNGVGVSGRPRAGSVGHFIFTHAFCSSHPSNIAQRQCRYFRSHEDLNQEIFRTRSQYRVTEVRTPPTFTPAPPSSPSMKMPRRASCDRGALSLKRYLPQIKVLLYCRRRR
jgi:hypothetical protein